MRRDNLLPIYLRGRDLDGSYDTFYDSMWTFLTTVKRVKAAQVS
jgi:hypothetical protein